MSVLANDVQSYPHLQSAMGVHFLLAISWFSKIPYESIKYDVKAEMFLKNIR